MTRSSALVLAVVVVLTAACGGDDDPSAGVTSVEGEFGEIVGADGTVLAVSTQGRVAVQQDDRLCVVDLAGGGDTPCTDVDGSLSASAVVFSPDGSKLAFDGLAAMLRAFDSDVRVLDVDSGEQITVADDGDDDPTGPQDVLPAWVDDTELAFLRLPGMGTGERDSAEVVFAGLDGGHVDAVNTAGDVGGRDVVVGSSAGVLDGRYVLAVGGDPSRLVAVDDGVVELVADLGGPGGSVGGISRNGERAVVVAGAPTSELLAAVHVATVGDDAVVATSSPFETVAATVSPDGRIVAAATAAGDGRRAGVTLWDPDVDDEQHLEPGDGVPTLDAVSGVVWTDDDRIVLWSSEGWQVVDVR